MSTFVLIQRIVEAMAEEEPALCSAVAREMSQAARAPQNLASKTRFWAIGKDMSNLEIAALSNGVEILGFYLRAHPEQLAHFRALSSKGGDK